jgi:hypothetical protein
MLTDIIKKQDKDIARLTDEKAAALRALDAARDVAHFAQRDDCDT